VSEVDLRDDLVRLRPLRRADVADITAACQDPETQRWTTIPVPYVESDAVWFVDVYAAERRTPDQGAVWAVCTPGEDRYAGSMEIRRDPADGAMADCGFATAPWARGPGLTTAALRLACRWAFDVMSVERVEWRACSGPGSCTGACGATAGWPGSCRRTWPDVAAEATLRRARTPSAQ